MPGVSQARMLCLGVVFGSVGIRGLELRATDGVRGTGTSQADEHVVI